MHIIRSKMKMASDEALVGIAQITLGTATYCYKNGQADLAFDMMYAQKDLPRNWRKLLPKELKEAEAKSLREVLISASENRSYTVDETKAEKLLENIVSELNAEHGEHNVQLIQSPLAHLDKKMKIVEIAIAFYSKILSLPLTDGGMLLRHLFMTAKENG